RTHSRSRTRPLRRAVVLVSIDAEPLASRPATGTERRDEPIFAVGHGHAYDALSRPLPHLGARACLSGKIQEFSHPGRRAFPDGLPICRKKCAASRVGAAGRSVALGFVVALAPP